MKILVLARVLCVATLLICAPAVLLAQTTPTAPAPVVVQPVPTPEPIGVNTTTFMGGGALLAVWEVVRRMVLPLVFPSNPPAPQPPQPPVPPLGPQGNPWFDLLRMVLEMLRQQPPPAMQAVTGVPLAERPPWVDEMLAELRKAKAA